MAIQGPYSSTPLGFNVASAQPIDRRIVVPNAAVRLNNGTPPSNIIINTGVYKGLLVYQQDEERLYAYIGPVPGTAMSGVQTAANWQEIGAGGSAIDAQGELVGDRELAVNTTNGEGTVFNISVDSLPPTYVYNFTGATVPDTSGWTIVNTSGTMRDMVVATSPTTNVASSVVATVTYEVYDSTPTLIETVVQNITLSTYDPVYTGVTGTQPTGFVSNVGSDVLASRTRIERGDQFSVPYTGSGETQYAVVNLPTRLGAPLFTVGGFELVFDNTNRFAAPGNAALIIDRRYTTYLIPVRQATTITLI